MPVIALTLAGPIPSASRVGPAFIISPLYANFMVFFCPWPYDDEGSQVVIQSFNP